MVPLRNQKDMVSVEYLPSGNMPGSILTWDGSICYGSFDISNKSIECGVPMLWQYAFPYSDPG